MERARSLLGILLLNTLSLTACSQWEPDIDTSGDKTPDVSEKQELAVKRVTKVARMTGYPKPDEKFPSPNNTPEDFARVIEALGVNTAPAAVREPLPVAIGKQAVSIRTALFSPHETIPAEMGLGRICASPTVACPPAIPIAVSGEVISEDAMALFHHYGVETLDVLL